MKRKLIMGGLLTLSLALTGCSNSGTTSGVAKDNKTPNEEKKTDKKENLQSPTIQEESIKVYKSPYDDNVNEFSYSAIIKNEGEDLLRIYPYTLTVHKKDGTVADTVPAFVTPMYLRPGDQAYVSAYGPINGLDETNYNKTTTNIDYQKTNKELLLLKPEKVLFQKPQGEIDSVGKVTGILLNETGKLAKDIEISAAMFDKEGKLLLTTQGYANNDLNDKESEGFSLDIYSSKEVLDQVVTVDVKAQGFIE
ncbi:hypothetical protein [Fictibacillus sp. JL2B1089]|uniref:hypothetical protein n=1 Tax=Fictibacillus sp. JL2B1089 TaxID=3399565 RepID=UPI003A8739C6